MLFTCFFLNDIAEFTQKYVNGNIANDNKRQKFCINLIVAAYIQASRIYVQCTKFHVFHKNKIKCNIVCCINILSSSACL